MSGTADVGYYEFIVGLLFVLAILDLSIGVSNDAVNFLNSAIGSRVASRRVILLVAGLGVLAGSLFSSGIMEVARSGIFNPDLFVFADVMVIFLAVMLADVLLLDLFNTFALPTSTTVSIVFELLGAATAMAVLIVVSDPNAAGILEYVKADRALLIIGGILLSITAAFITGSVVQFFSRLLFTFQSHNHTATIRIGWCALAFTVISYFLIVKGLRGTGLITDSANDYILANAPWLILGSFGLWTGVMWLLNRLRVDLLATVVLAGTFSLALAFASNDLVNFIGVPLAGLAAWSEWKDSALPAAELTMEALSGPVQGNTIILLGAGIIMVVTLWLSSKARSVTQTEVNLGRQDEGAERFQPGPMSRGIVRTVIVTGEAAMQALPEQWRAEVSSRFEREREDVLDVERPAFDTLRASVNLTVASILIVFATSLKLPLSTTFVSFMVAMGTSLADQAWGRDSAVYRLAGVFSVIGGWFVTAIGAFVMAAVFAVTIKLFGGVAIVALVILAGLALVHSYRYHERRSRMEQVMRLTSPDRMDREALALHRHLSDALIRNGEIIDSVLGILIRRRRKRARRLLEYVRNDVENTRDIEREFVRRLNKLKPEVEPWLMTQLSVLSCERDMQQSSTSLVNLACEHVLNEHSPPTSAVTRSLEKLRRLFDHSCRLLAGQTGERTTDAPFDEVRSELDGLTSLVLGDMYSGTTSTRNTTIMLGIILELGELLRELRRAAGWR